MSEEPIRRRSYLIGVVGASVSLVSGCVSASNSGSEADNTDNTAPQNTTDPDTSTDQDHAVTAVGAEMPTPPENIKITNDELVGNRERGLAVKGQAKNTGDHPVSFRVVASFSGNKSGLTAQGDERFDAVESGATVSFEINPDETPNEEIIDHSTKLYSVPDTPPDH